MSAHWNTRWRWDTVYSADSVEWCPVEPYRDVLVCGTYQLEKKDDQDKEAKKQRRLGRIYLFIIDQATTVLAPVQTIDTSGVLDQKWCHHNVHGHPLLGVVTSEGVIELYRLVDGNRLELWMKEVIGTDLLALSLDWSTNKNGGEPMVVVSDSAGRVLVMKVGCGLVKLGEWQSHGYEAWIAAFNYWNPDVFYSGGDDCVFKSYDVRVPEVAVATNRSHEAGVTTVRSHVDVEHQLLTGSYDEKVRLWDTRSLKRPVTETDAGGGVWRLKWHPRRRDSALAACMYGGFRVLHVAGDVTVLCEYVEHESIAYGADWKFDDASIVATCSFYDCKMHVSEVSL